MEKVLDSHYAIKWQTAAVKQKLIIIILLKC